MGHWTALIRLPVAQIAVVFIRRQQKYHWQQRLAELRRNFRAGWVNGDAGPFFSAGKGFPRSNAHSWQLTDETTNGPWFLPHIDQWWRGGCFACPATVYQ